MSHACLSMISDVTLSTFTCISCMRLCRALRSPVRVLHGKFMLLALCFYYLLKQMCFVLPSLGSRPASYGTSQWGSAHHILWTAHNGTGDGGTGSNHHAGTRVWYPGATAGEQCVHLSLPYEMNPFIVLIKQRFTF